MDWNNDGKKDLLTGENYGYIRIYLNTGTDANPVFTGYSLLQLGASTFDCGSYSIPYIADWNNDGKKDVLCGESGGKIYLLINTGTDANPVFTSSTFIENKGSILDVGTSSNPCVVDWNRDGRKDLLVGEYSGVVAFLANVGTDEDPLFQGVKKLKVGSSDLDVGYYSRCDVADWDNDGTLDLFVGDSNGYVTCFRAIGPLALSDNKISESTGGAIDFYLDAGPAHGNRSYLLLGSVSGKVPGTPLPGGQATLPLNWDFFTNVVVSLANSPIFANFSGVLSSGGRATAQLNIPSPVPGAAGIVMSYAFALGSPFDYASNGADIEVVP